MADNKDQPMDEKEQKQRLFLECMALAYAVQENTDYCVFIDFSGHVDSCTISIRESKKNWQKNACETELQNKFSKYWKAKECLASLKATRDILKDILKTNEIPYHKMTEQVEQIYSYYW